MPFDIKAKLKEMPLEIRLKVSNEAAMINLLSKLGYKKGCWTDKEDDKLNKLIGCAIKLTEEHLETIKQWEEDGRHENLNV